MTEYLNPRTGQTWPLAVPRWCAPDGTPLMLTRHDGLTRQEIDRETRSLWRYRCALPTRPRDPITLGEGCTPLLRRTLNGVPAHIKCEWTNPTGSFKDRGASVMLTLLRAQGVRHVLEDSSGNGGAAVAAYAAAGGMRATIMAPDSTSPAKLLQARVHGAAVERVPGTRGDTAAAAERRGREDAGLFYASHNWHPFFLHGTKTLAYELWEDLGFQAPDHVIIPCGAGSNVLGCDIGFRELLDAGEIAAMPRLWAAQPAACGPIAAAFHAGPDAPATAWQDAPIRPTIAEGTAIARPIRLPEVVAALRGSGGGAVTLEEDEIGAATLALARQGMLVEPTCAQAAAAHEKLVRAGTIRPRETAVVVLTGTGLKAAARITELLDQAGA